MRLIDAESVMDILHLDPGIATYQLEMIRKLPTIDVVEVVRCRDCIYYTAQHLFENWCERG